MLNRRAWLHTYGTAAICGSVGVANVLFVSSDRIAAAGPMANDLLISWNDIARKLVDMAEDFPDDKYDWRPASGVRSFAEQLLHAAGFVTYVAANAKGLHPNVADPARASSRRRRSRCVSVLVCWPRRAVSSVSCPHGLPVTARITLRRRGFLQARAQ